MIELTAAGMAQVPEKRRQSTRLFFTAHSVPESMARQCAYQLQFREAAQLIAAGAGVNAHSLAYQSRSGSPHSPWLEPDILDEMRRVKHEGATDVVIVPVGFISDHMEVMFDLDTEAKELADELELGFVRVPTVGTHPRFVAMIRELIVERMSESPERPALGRRGPSHDICPANCCLLGAERPLAAAGPEVRS
jgi:ferrochelatase